MSLVEGVERCFLTGFGIAKGKMIPGRFNVLCGQGDGGFLGWLHLVVQANDQADGLCPGLLVVWPLRQPSTS